MAKEADIKLIAYSLWEQEGCLNGKDCEHWFRAEAIWEENHKPKPVAAISSTQPKPVDQKIEKNTPFRKKKR